MAWLRTGDNVANHPIVLAVLEHPQATDTSVNETFGFIMRCALQSAAHFTDYVISYGTALALAGSKSQADQLLELATSAGYITPAETLDGKPAFKLIEDSDFIHIRSKEEIDFERQRDRDRKDQGLTVPVWLRDGDACRYCRRIVQWSDKKSQRSGTFDHLSPGSAATHDTYVVACRGCNSALSDLAFEERSKYLLSVPPVPHCSLSRPCRIARVPAFSTGRTRSGSRTTTSLHRSPQRPPASSPVTSSRAQPRSRRSSRTSRTGTGTPPQMTPSHPWRRSRAQARRVAQTTPSRLLTPLSTRLVARRVRPTPRRFTPHETPTVMVRRVRPAVHRFTPHHRHQTMVRAILLATSRGSIPHRQQPPRTTTLLTWVNNDPGMIPQSLRNPPQSKGGISRIAGTGRDGTGWVGLGLVVSVRAGTGRVRISAPTLRLSLPPHLLSVRGGGRGEDPGLQIFAGQGHVRETAAGSDH